MSPYDGLHDRGACEEVSRDRRRDRTPPHLPWQACQRPEHVDATLRIIAPEMAVEAIKPKVFRPPADWSKRGEITRVVLSILRTARAPMTRREIAERMVVERGLVADTATLNAMGRRVACALRRQRELGHARSTEGEAGFWQLWEIVR